MIELIPVFKGDDYLEVHPTTLGNHIAIGWRQCPVREMEKASNNAAEGMTVAELKAALATKGIAIPDGAKKPELQTLLDGAAS